jgi:hypothetical protein
MQKRTKQDKIKIGLFTFSIFLLMAPMLQQNLEIFQFKPLRGAYKKLKEPKFSYVDWFSAKYQDRLQKYADQNIGFRSFLVRLYNQMYYSFFNHARANNVVVGKDNYLYQKPYIDAYTGRDFIGKEAIETRMSKLKVIEDSLSNHGIELIVILAPGKASFYPEYIPDKYNPSDRSLTNYEYYRNQLAEKSIPTLDFRKWFLEMKDTSRYPLFPKTGIHWSKYGEYLVLDSLLSYISMNHEGFTPDLRLNSIVESDSMRSTDGDIERGMNLLFNIEDLRMAYPDFEYDPFDNKTINILAIGDSFFNMIFKEGLKRKVFGNSQYWYYNKTIVKTFTKKFGKVEGKNLLNEVLERDVIILINTESLLRKFSFGFIENLYYEFTVKRKRILKFTQLLRENKMLLKQINLFLEGSYTLDNQSVSVAADRLFEMEESFLKKRLIKKIEKGIQNNPKWLANVKRKALKNNIKLEQAIANNAKSFVKGKLKKNAKNHIHISEMFDDPKIKKIDSSYLSNLIRSQKEYRISVVMEIIENTPKWKANVKKQAEKTGITFKEAIKNNATFFVNKELKRIGSPPL